MPFSNGVFSRIWAFVDQFLAKEEVRRSDLDIAFNDVSDGLNGAIDYLEGLIGALSGELFLGVKPTAPSTNNEGGTLLLGNTYILQSTGVLFYHNGSSWVKQGDLPAATAFFKTLVVADDASSFRGLLGLGSASTANADSFAATTDLTNHEAQTESARALVATGGSGNAFTISAISTLSAYVDNQVFTILFNRAPTGPSTLNVDGLGAKDIRKYDNTQTLVDLEANDILRGEIRHLVYDGTRFIVAGPVRANDTIPGVVRLVNEADMASSDPQAAASQQSVQTFVNSKRRTSSAQSIVSGGLVTVPHGLAKPPGIVLVRLKCIDVGGDSGFVLDDEIFVSLNGSGSGTTRRNVIYIDNTNVYFRFNSLAQCFGTCHKNSGTGVNLTNNKWEMYLEMME